MDLEKIKKINVKIIGIGDGGANIVCEVSQKIKKTNFLIVNGKGQFLKKIPKNVERFELKGKIPLESDFEGVEKLVRENEEKIKKVLKNVDLAIFIICLGGATGSGAGFVFSEISQRLGNLNYGIFTLPFKFEGKKKREIASFAFQKIKENFHSFSIIENDKIFQLVDKSVSLKNAFSELNKILAKNIQGLIELIFQPCLINIDFADIKSVLTGRGKLVFLNSAKAKDKNRAKEALEKVLKCPLYSYNIDKAKEVLFNIAGGKDLTLTEVREISEKISQISKSNKIIFGICEKKDLQNQIELTLLASGCQALNFDFLNLSQKEEPLPILTKNQKNQKKQKKENSNEIRKNALQVKEEIKKMEKEMLEKEKFWEIPAIFRQKKKKNAKNI